MYYLIPACVLWVVAIAASMFNLSDLVVGILGLIAAVATGGGFVLALLSDVGPRF